MPLWHADEQRTEGWYEKRLGKPTASQFSKIITPKRLQKSTSWDEYMARLVAERIFKRSFERDISGDFAVRWGVEHEAEARDALQQQLGREIRQTGFCTNDAQRYGCSPDGVIDHGNYKELAEIKCPQIPRQVETLLFDLDDDYKAQLQGQLLITGYQSVVFFSYHPDCPSKLIEVGRDEKFITALSALLDEFCHDLELNYRRAKNMGVWKTS